MIGASGDGAAIHASTVLVVDDEARNRALIARILRREGYQVILASDGDECLVVSDKAKPDAIVLDVAMPGMAGIELTKRLKAQSSTRDIPIVVLTSMQDRSTRLEALKSGADEFLTRPVDPIELSSRMRNLVRLKRLSDELREHNEDLENLVRVRSQQLADSEQEYRTLVAALPTTILRIDRDAHILFVNRALEGVQPEEALGTPVYDYIQTDQHSTVRAALDKVFQTGRPGFFETVSPCAKRGMRHYSTHVSPLLCGSTVAQAILVVLDTTEEAAARDALAASQQRFEQLAQATSEGLLFVASDGRVLDGNDQAGRMLSLSIPKQLASVFDLFEDASREAIEKSLGQAGGDLCSQKIASAAGCDRIVDVSVRLLSGSDGAEYIVALRDVTAQRSAENAAKNAQLELLQVHKLEAVGQLAAGVAHEINTPMQYIGNNVEFLQLAFECYGNMLEIYEDTLAQCHRHGLTDELLARLDQSRKCEKLGYLRTRLPGAISKTIEGVAQVSRIVGAMKQFSHPGADEKTPVDLNEAIHTTITIARNEWKYHAKIVTNLDSDLPLVPCLPGEINQVFLNLLINAAHAISDVPGAGEAKGTITVDTGIVDGCAQISVSDTGAGIPVHLLHKIFEPFFTTKKVGKGTGQGLAICRSVVVDKHSGAIAVETEMGKGTTFVVRLPLEAK